MKAEVIAGIIVLSIATISAVVPVTEYIVNYLPEGIEKSKPNFLANYDDEPIEAPKNVITDRDMQGIDVGKLPACIDPGSYLRYDTGANTFSCGVSR